MSLREWKIALLSSSRGGTRDTRVCLRQAGLWLLQAQTAGAGGYAHSYSLWKGWLPAYPETTGYLIETLFELGDLLKEPAFVVSARRAGEWLLTLQNADGSFNDLSGQPQVFDTAQILQGLLSSYQRLGQETYLAAALRAGEWLTRAQDSDGKWTRHAYQGVSHSYYIKVAAALLALGAVSKKAVYGEAAQRHIVWVLGRQLSNGFFQQAGFIPGYAPFLHTVIYILEGLIDVQRLTPEKEVLAAVRALSEALRSTEKQDGLLYSRYDDDWRPALRQRCLVGQAQWAKAGVALSDLLKDETYLRSAEMNMEYLKKKQVRDPDSPITGALPASSPVWGDYVPYSFINWGVKYFIDAGLALERRAVSL